MRADIGEQERAYRRGVVLGLTMAEIMTLVIFALLLALTALTVAREKQIHDLAARNAVLARQLAAATPPGMDPQRIEDIFRELSLAGDPNAPETVKELTDRLALADRVIAAAKEGGVPPVPASIAEMLRQARDADSKIANLRGQVANIQQAMRAYGKGTQFPPCWADEITGKPEYIFDVSITSVGLVIRDNAIAHRSADEARLPIQGITFGRTISVSAFLAQTRPLRDWSDRQDPVCRFFVRLYDLTGDAEKATFKTGLRTVEAHFYKILMEGIVEAPR